MSFVSQIIDLLRQSQRDQNAFFQRLEPAELERIGEPDSWSAKDHVAHLSFWRQRLVDRLEAFLEQRPQPQTEEFEIVNPRVFVENRYRLWPDILAESEQIYARLLFLTEQIDDEALSSSEICGYPLYLSYLGNCYEHTSIHLGYYLLDRHDLVQARSIYELWAQRVVDAEVPEPMKGNILYNLACFYALHDQLPLARETLVEAFRLYPEAQDFARSDADLAALYQ